MSQSHQDFLRPPPDHERTDRNAQDDEHRSLGAKGNGPATEYGTSYRVAWDDGHESTFRPTAGTVHTVHTVHPQESATG